MKYLLDTCVISELVRSQPAQVVIEWFKQQSEHNLFLSVLTFGEIEKGIEKSVSLDQKKKLALWVEHDLKQRFEKRIIPIDLAVAAEWGRVQESCEKKGLPMPAIDGLIAVSALVYQCTVVTRNTEDMRQSGVRLLNPWNA
ncbi:hypothetical protein MNBD_GAMMA07-1092 [hydrothermal vent metagenome]|uniref:PIN domain-containing protein n=1 Tax=hydrothermal vent metagenome TaxID=652676 RepID=A0A3B0WYL7_9ZZZZ